MPGPKVVYLARRHPSLDAPSFVRRWREHGALGISQPRWGSVYSYHHCDVLRDLAVAGTTSEGDGVGVITFRSWAHRAAHVADTASQARMVADEDDVFAEHIAHRYSICQETVVADGVPTDRKIIRFLWRDVGTSHDEFRDAWLASARERSATVEGFAPRYVVNLPVEAPSPDRGLGCDGIEELWLAADADPEHVIALTQPLFGSRVDTLLTNDVTLYQIH